MVVRNQQGIQARHLSPVQCKPFLDLDAADPGVEQEPDTMGLNVDAVAVATGLEGDDLHGRILRWSGQFQKEG